MVVRPTPHVIWRPPLLLALLASGAAWPSARANRPEIRSLRLLTPRIQRYGHVELSAEVDGEWENPFDPDQIDLRACFTAPSGVRLTVPGFWYQEYEEQPPATRARERVEFVTFFTCAAEWQEGTQVELFLDDIHLVDESGAEVLFDDMEQGETPRAEAVDGASPAFSSEVVHGGKRSLRFVPTLAGGQHWPAALFRPGHPDWSPDGQEIVFLRRTGQHPTVHTICVKQWPNGPGRELGYADSSPSWSPDGAYVLFYADGNLWVVPAAGGTAYRVSETFSTGGAAGPAWFAHPASGDNWTAYTTGAYAPGGGQVVKLQVDAAGHALGDPVAITPDRPGWPEHPSWSPDGTYIAYNDHWSAKKGEVSVTCVVEVAGGSLYEVGDLADVDWAPQ
jgi:hypothetical protein